LGDLRTRWTLMPSKLRGYRLRAYVYLAHRLVRDNQIRTRKHRTEGKPKIVWENKRERERNCAWKK